MGMTGELKVAPPARAGARQADPDGLAARLGRARASRRRPARCSPARATCSARRWSMSGVIPQVAALMGPCAAGTAYIPGLADFVPMVKGRGSMALAGPHLAQGRDRRGRHPGGARRLERPHRRSPASATSRSSPTRSASQAIKDYLSFFPPELRGAAAAARAAPTRSTACDEELLDVLPDVAPQALRHVRGHPPDRRRRRRASTSSPASRARSSPASRAWAAGPWASWPTSRSSSAASSRTTPPTRPRASSTSATRSASRWCSCRTCPGFMVGTKVEQAGIIRHGAKMLYAVSRATVPEDHRGAAQGLRRRLLRDVRQGLRARPDRRLADARRSR